MADIQELKKHARAAIRAELDAGRLPSAVTRTEAGVSTAQCYTYVLQQDPRDVEAELFDAFFAAYPVSEPGKASEKAEELEEKIKDVFPLLLEIDPRESKEVFLLSADCYRMLLRYYVEQSDDLLDQFVQVLKDHDDGSPAGKLAVLLGYSAMMQGFAGRNAKMLAFTTNCFFHMQTYMERNGVEPDFLAAYEGLVTEVVNVLVQKTPMTFYDKDKYKTMWDLLEGRYQELRRFDLEFDDYMPEPDYSGYWQPYEATMQKAYRESEICKRIARYNDKVRARRIERYWTEHAEEKVELETRKAALETERRAHEAIMRRSDEEIAGLEKARAAAIEPARKTMDDLGCAVVAMERELAGLNIFQGKRKKELRALIPERTAERDAAKAHFEQVVREQDALLARARTAPEERKAQAAQKEASLRDEIREIQTRLERPLD